MVWRPFWLLLCKIWALFQELSDGLGVVVVVVSVLLHGAILLAMWSSGGISDPETKMRVIWKEC